MIKFADSQGNEIDTDYTGVIFAFCNGKQIASCEQSTENPEEFSSDPCNPTSWNILSSDFTREKILTISIVLANTWTNYWVLKNIIYKKEE